MSDVLKPKCHPYWIIEGVRIENHPVSMEHSSRGYILPCCWLDSTDDNVTQQLKNIGMLDECLKLENNRTVKDIMISPQWIKFHKTLLEDPRSAVSVCKIKCGKDKAFNE